MTSYTIINPSKNYTLIWNRASSEWSGRPQNGACSRPPNTASLEEVIPRSETKTFVVVLRFLTNFPKSISGAKANTFGTGKTDPKASPLTCMSRSYFLLLPAIADAKETPSCDRLSPLMQTVSKDAPYQSLEGSWLASHHPRI
jgi:hypothetical protein